MELALNILWLLISALALRQWLRHGRDVRRGLTLAAGSLVLLVCVLWLLFPIVSVSDDLHHRIAVVEEPGSAPRWRLALQPPPQALWHPLVLALAVLAALWFPLLRFGSALALVLPGVHPPVLLTPSLRSPPLS